MQVNFLMQKLALSQKPLTDTDSESNDAHCHILIREYTPHEQLWCSFSLTLNMLTFQHNLQTVLPVQLLQILPYYSSFQSHSTPLFANICESVQMTAYPCVYVYVCMNMCYNLHTTCIHVHLCMCVCVCVCLCVCVSVCTCMCVCVCV